MKKVLSLILSMVIIFSCASLSFAVPADLFEEHMELVQTFNYYYQSVFHPINEKLLDTEITSVVNWLAGKAEIGLVDYPDYRATEAYFEKYPDHLEPINAILRDIINETEDKIASGDFIVVVNMVTIMGQFNEIMGKIGLTFESYESFAQTLPKNTFSLLNEKFNAFNLILEEASTDYTSHTTEEVDAAAKEFFDLLSSVVDCIKGDHKVITYTDNGNGTHSEGCVFCGYSGEASQHNFTEYAETDFGLIIEKCTVCTATNTIVDEEILNNITIDTYAKKLAKVQSFNMNLYSSKEDLIKVSSFLGEAFLKFNEDIYAVFGEDGFYSDISKEWIDENKDKLPVITLVFGYAGTMFDKAKENREINITVDTAELFESISMLNATHTSEELNAFITNVYPEKFNEFNNAMEETSNILAMAGVYPPTVSQAEFDNAASPVINFYNEVKNCLDGNHSGEYVNLSNGTHKLHCNLCVNTGAPEAHTFGEYTDNLNGTKTAKCSFCDETDTIDVEIPDISEGDSETDALPDEESKLPPEETEKENSIFFEAFIKAIKDFFTRIADFFKNLFK